MPCESTDESTNNDTLDSSNAKESLSFLPTKRGFKLSSLNINSLPKHIDELRVLLADRPLTEVKAWLLTWTLKFPIFQRF